jgi:GntR family transcriptional regulator
MPPATQRITKQSQTRDRVIDLIESIGVGGAIPSERQLSAQLGVSRLTLRAALDELVRAGYLVRRRGSGTFVSEPKIAQELTMTSFSEEMRRRGMRPGARTLSLTTTTAGAYLGRSLHVSPSERIVVAKRLRIADEETMAIETLHVRESLVPGLTARDLEDMSFYELLSQRYGIEIVGGVQAIEPTVTNDEESEALGVPLHSPAFLFERTTRSQTGEIVEFVRSIYRGDRYRLVTELNREPTAGAPVLVARDGR